MAAIITQIETPTNYTPSDEVLLNPSITQSVFNPSTDYIEYTVTTPNNSFSVTDYNYQNYSFPVAGVTSDSIDNIIINPELDLNDNGYNNGEFNVYYNFLKNELNSSALNPSFFINDISSDRTEVIIKSTNDVNIINDVNNFRSQLNSNPNYFQDFFLNFGGNILCVANNIEIDNDTLDIYINLYEPLPNNIQVKDTLWIVTQIADELAFNVSFTPEIVVPTITSYPIKGPNFNISIQDQTNNSTGFETYSTLITSSLLSTSYSQLNNLISSSGIQIGVDYTDFSNFTHFSSAVTRINNFVYKVGLIEQYNQEIATLNSLSSVVTSSNISVLTNQINNIIENFDGYEYYLYYGSGSWSYPKSTSTVPYTLYSIGSAQVINWLGNEDNLTGILGSASIYDQSNQDYLYNVVPTYIQEDPQNDPYKLFVEMVAQHYDNIWIYYKDVTNRYNADNRLDHGISKDLVANALKSFGVKLYQNNFSTNDLYSAFLGYGNPNPNTTGSLPVTAGTGQEYIKRYITASYAASVTPLDDVNKEVYKRLYHNLPYLAKTKGTIPGLRALINCFGIPDTILRISEFGGRDKDTSTYDYFDQQYNYRLNRSNDPIKTPWQLYSSWGSGYPQSVQFRFKSDPITSSAVPTRQSLFTILDADENVTSSLVLNYNGNWTTSASYSGSTYSASYQYADLIFYPNPIDDPLRSASLSLPFYNNDWWSIMINYQESGGQEFFTIYAGNKLYYDGYDGNQIGFIKSSSILFTSPTNWQTGTFAFFSKPFSFSDGRNTISYKSPTGSYQEIRYWSRPNGVDAFKDYIMNPSSIEGSVDYLAFRAPLGNELYTGSVSVHPKITGSWGSTPSFELSIFGGSSSFNVGAGYVTNIEPFFYNQPITGIKNRVTDKIQIISSSLPTGSVLSQYRSLEQNYPVSGSETPDINLLEVAFSPQNEINNDIISSLGYFNIGEYIGDPRQVTSSATTYPDLVNLSNDFFQKYFASYDLFDYIRLIKYFDNSLFKMIQDFVPARTSLASGVVIKQHILERNKYPQPQVEWEDVTYSGSVYSQQIWDEDITGSYIETSIIENIFGKTGGTFDSYNFTGSTIPPTFINNTQSWGEEVKTPVGSLIISHSTQDEFYNGELPYSDILVSDGELNPNNPFKYPDATIINYNTYLYKNSTQFPNDISYDITNLDTFLSPNTVPDSGEIYLWYDDSTYNIGAPPIAGNTYSWDTYSSRYSTEKIKYIKISNIDLEGNNNSNNLAQQTSLTLSLPDGDFIYPVYSIQNYGNYYLYSIGPYLPVGPFAQIGSPNTSSLGGILNYSTVATQSSFTYPYLGLTLLTASLTASSGNSLGYFDNNTSTYTLGNTPNTAITFKLSTTASVSIPPGGGAKIYLLSTRNIPGSNTVTAPLSSPGYIYYPLLLQIDGLSSGEASVTFYGTSSLIDGDRFRVAVSSKLGGEGITLTNLTLTISQSILNFTPSQSLTIFDPYLPSNVLSYDYNEYNPLIDNANIPQESDVFMDIDYSQNPLIPINQSLILQGSATRAQVQDSNYASKAWSNIRYNGSKYNSVTIKTKLIIGNNITSPAKSNPFG
jgi:hypothetical protein